MQILQILENGTNLMEKAHNIPDLYEVTQPREQKPQVLSPLYSISFLISVRIALYHYRKSGHHLGVKAQKLLKVILFAFMEQAYPG